MPETRCFILVVSTQYHFYFLVKAVAFRLNFQYAVIVSTRFLDDRLLRRHFHLWIHLGQICNYSRSNMITILLQLRFKCFYLSFFNIELGILFVFFFYIYNYIYRSDLVFTLGNYLLCWAHLVAC